MSALDELIAAVESGTAINDDFDCVFQPSLPGTMAIRAYHGSLDAARALHDSLLPGWEWRLCENRAWVWRTPADLCGGDEIEDDDSKGLPARAWLLSILKALKGKENV